MDKSQSIQEFWSSFGIPAYDETTVPSGDVKPDMPYITYSVITGAMEDMIPLSASVWYKGTRWDEISQKVDEIAEKLGKRGFHLKDIDGGHVWMTRGEPFAQRMGDPEDDMVRRYYINVNAEFLTAY